MHVMHNYKIYFCVYVKNILSKNLILGHLTASRLGL